MTARHGTGAEFTAVPVDLGQALAFPGVYLEPPAGLPALMPAPARRRPRRARRMMAVLAAAAAAAGLMLAGCASTATHGPAPRPAWDGRGTYDSGIEPLCPPRLASHSAMAGAAGHKFAVVCAWDGAEYAWSLR